MVMCWAPDCKHYNVREKCHFFRFRNRWKKLLRRKEEPGNGAYICSCHFEGGNKENGPTIFLHNIKKKMTFSSPEKRTRINRLTADSTTSSSVATSDVDLQPSTSKEEDFPLLAATDAENYFLRQDLLETTKQLQSVREQFSFNIIKDRDHLVLLYTGLPTARIFLALYELLENIPFNYVLPWKVEKLNKQDQLLMALMKLRQNFSHEDLGVRFNVSRATVSNVVATWIHILHEILFKQLMHNIPSRKKNQLCSPNCFSSFTNCKIILDCTEIYTSTSRKSMSLQKGTYSSYKHKNTWKGLVGVAPNGVITYVSNLCGGSVSEKKIVLDCGILQQLEPGDLILADKGFLIKDILPEGVHMNIPPFLTTPQFTSEQVRQTERIARARIHVERAIRRMKVYNILSFIPQTLLPHADAIFQVVAALTNLQYPLIKEVEQFYTE